MSPQAAPSQPILATLAPSVNNSVVMPVNITLSPFTALQATGGSVQVFWSANFFNPFIVTRDLVENPPGTFTDVFYAMDSTCTHQNSAVSAYNAGAGAGTNLMVCPNHGSTYDIQGNVDTPYQSGQGNLARLPCLWDGNNIVEVELKSSFSPNIVFGNSTGPTAVPTVPLKVTDFAKQSVIGGNTRWKLTFPVVRYANYQVKYYNDFSSAPTAMQFSEAAGTNPSKTTYVYRNPEAPATDTSNPLYFAKSNKTIYVDIPTSMNRGFVAIQMLTRATFTSTI